jgi:hypothetical protein
MYRELVVMACLLSLPAFGATGADTTDLTLNGSAKIITGGKGSPVLWLTPAQQSQAGSAFTTNSISFNEFSTFFQFQMTDPGYYGASDGMTFTLQTEGATALGANGGDLGYAGITPSVAVGFKTWQDPGNFNDNYVSVFTNGEINDLDPKTPYGVTACQPSTGVFGCMSNGDVWSVWIDYDGTNLHVAIVDNSTTRPRDLLTYPIDIPSILGQSSAFIGFTAGTGAGYENHLVANWQFR